MHYFWRIIAVESIAILQSALHSFNCTADSAVQLNEYNLLQCAEKASSNSWWVEGLFGGWVGGRLMKTERSLAGHHTVSSQENFHFHWKLSLSSVASLKTKRNNTEARKMKSFTTSYLCAGSYIMPLQLLLMAELSKSCEESMQWWKVVLKEESSLRVCQ